MKRLIILALLSAMAIMLTGCDDDEDPTAQVRVVHASPDAPNVDVLVNNNVALSAVPFKGVSRYLSVDLGDDPNFKINAAGTSTTVIDDTLPLEEGKQYTLLAVNTLSNIEPLLLADETASPASGFLKVRVLHASPSAPEVDVYVTAPGDDIATMSPALSDVSFKDYSDYLEIAEGDYRVRVTGAGSKTPVYDSGTVALGAGVTYTIVAVTTTTGLSPISLLVLTGDNSNPSIEIADVRAQVRAVHAAYDAPAVDVLVDNVEALGDVPFKAASSYLEVLSGARNFKINAANTSNTVIQATPTLERGLDYTLIAVGSLTSGTLEPLLAVDDNSAPASGKAKVRVIHASPDAPAVDIYVDSTKALSNVPYKAISNYLEVDAGQANIQVFAAGTTTSPVIDATVTLADGTIYTIIAMNQLSAIEPVVLEDN
ncbi:MAG: DUF4397 domain-containing protein [Pseudomonadota bacterium]